MILKKMKMKNSYQLVFLFLVISSLSSCCFISGSKYDSSTFNNFGGIRGRILILYEVLQYNIDEVQITDVRNSLISLQNYENGKSCNSESIKLADLLVNMFDLHIKDRRAEKWTTVIKDNYSEQINKLIDQAMKAEEAKSK